MALEQKQITQNTVDHHYFNDQRQGENQPIPHDITKTLQFDSDAAIHPITLRKSEHDFCESAFVSMYTIFCLQSCWQSSSKLSQR